LRKLEAFHRVYMELFEAGNVAPRGSHWFRDNQHAYTMFLTARHNGDVQKDRVENNGVLLARYEPADELTDCIVELRPAIEGELDGAEYPLSVSFLPADVYTEILQQQPPKLSEVSVAFPRQVNWQQREEMVSSNKSTLFMAAPPRPVVGLKKLTFWHRQAVEMITDGREQILYLYGATGTGRLWRRCESARTSADVIGRSSNWKGCIGVPRTDSTRDVRLVARRVQDGESRRQPTTED